MKKNLFLIIFLLLFSGYVYSNLLLTDSQDDDMTELISAYDTNTDNEYDDMCKTIPLKPVPAWRTTLNSIGSPVLSYCLNIKRTLVKYTKRGIQMTSYYLISLRKHLGI